MSEPRPQLRVGDRERDLVASVLQDALAEGRITLEELDQRLDAVLRARTFAELDPLVADLPVEPPSSALTRPRAGVESRLVVSPGISPHDPLVLDAGWSSVTRSGRWQIPPFLMVNGAIGTVKLDCLEATALAEVIDIEVVGGAGTITIVLPESWGANTDRLISSWGMARHKASTTPAPGAPLLLLHGSTGWGSLTIRNASRFDRRRMEKHRGQLPRRPEISG